MFDGAILRAVLNTTNRYRTKQTARKNSSDRSHLGLGRDILPLLLVKLKPPALYLRPEKSPVDMAERGVTAQQDVHDHADAPHVDRLKRQIFMRPTVWAEEGRREERKEKKSVFREERGWAQDRSTAHPNVEPRQHITMVPHTRHTRTRTVYLDVGADWKRGHGVGLHHFAKS